MQSQSRDYQQVAKAIAYIADRANEQPTLQQIASHVGASDHHFQKIFSRWAGVSPKRFLQYLTKEQVKRILLQDSVEEAAFSTGLSTKSRVYDLMVNCEAMTPGEYKHMGKDLVLHYGYHPTPFGICFIAITPKGICKLAFVQEGEEEQIQREFEQEWQLATRVRDQKATAPYIDGIFSLAENRKPLHLVLKGTNFQIKVWEALVGMPLGKLTTYEQIATSIEQPTASRAVGSAIGKNPVAFLIPCHRVIRKTGEINQYRWGSTRKRAIIGWEQAQLEQLEA